MAKASSIIRVSVVGDATDLAKAFKGAEGSAKSFGEKAKGVSRTITNSITLPLIGAGIAVVGLAQKQEEAERKMESTFKSMGAAAWTNTEAIKANASALQDQTTFGDEAILGLQDLLLTFGNVTNKIGEGNDIFSRATELGLDMSAALGQDLKSSAIQLGKALNDPIAGITALTRVGVSFTDEQKTMIKTMTRAGDVVGAQKVILEELEKQFGGTAEAMAETSSGKIQQAMNTLGDLGEEVGASLAMIASEAIPNFVAGVSIVKDFFDSLPGPVQKAIVAIGGLVLALAALYAHPIIAGLALVAAAVTFIGKSSRDAEKDVAGFRKLMEETGKTGKDLALVMLETRDDTDDLRVMLAKAGLTLDDLAGRVDGGRDAYMKYSTAVVEARDEGRLTKEEIQRLTGVTIDLSAALDQAETDMNLVTAAETKASIETANLEGSMRLAGGGVRGLSESAFSLSEDMGTLEQSTRDVYEVTDQAREALVAYTDEQRKAVDPLYALRSAQEDVRKKQQELNSMVAAGQTKTSQFRDKQYELVKAYGDLAYAEQVYKGQADVTIGAFERMARKAGLTEDEIRALIRAFQDLGKVSKGAQGGLGDPGVPSPPPPGGKHTPLQTGGIVQGPTGSPVPVVAHAGEMVLNPQQQRALLRGGTGSGVTINVHAGTILTETGLEDVIIRVMSRYGLRNGGRNI